MNASGQIIKVFDGHQHLDIGEIQFHVPRYLALEANNSVIVADQFNERIVVLESDDFGLRLKRILIPYLPGQPWRLCLSQGTGLLFVALYGVTALSVFRIC